VEISVAHVVYSLHTSSVHQEISQLTIHLLELSISRLDLAEFVDQDSVGQKGPTKMRREILWVSELCFYRRLLLELGNPSWRPKQNNVATFSKSGIFSSQKFWSQNLIQVFPHPDPDLDPYQNFMDPQHCPSQQRILIFFHHGSWIEDPTIKKEEGSK
jgi:hypothetical protein